MAEQPGCPAGTAGLPGATRPAAAAIANQQSTGPARVPGPRGPVSAWADQRAPEQLLGRRIHYLEQGTEVLKQGTEGRAVGGLGEAVGARTCGQGLRELVVKGRRLRAEGLKLAGTGARTAPQWPSTPRLRRRPAGWWWGRPRPRWHPRSSNRYPPNLRLPPSPILASRSHTTCGVQPTCSVTTNRVVTWPSSRCRRIGKQVRTTADRTPNVRGITSKIIEIVSAVAQHHTQPRPPRPPGRGPVNTMRAPWLV